MSRTISLGNTAKIRMNSKIYMKQKSKGSLIKLKRKNIKSKKVTTDLRELEKKEKLKLLGSLTKTEILEINLKTTTTEIERELKS